MGLGPSLSWEPMETEIVGKSGTSVYDFDDIGLAHALRAQNVDRLGHPPYLYPTMVYWHKPNRLQAQWPHAWNSGGRPGHLWAELIMAPPWQFLGESAALTMSHSGGQGVMWQWNEVRSTRLRLHSTRTEHPPVTSEGLCQMGPKDKKCETIQNHMRSHKIT